MKRLALGAITVIILLMHAGCSQQVPANTLKIDADAMSQAADSYKTTENEMQKDNTPLKIDAALPQAVVSNEAAAKKEPENTEQKAVSLEAKPSKETIVKSVQPMTAVKMGDRNYKVKELQEKLNKFKYNLTADGVFGSATLAALKSFQYSVSLQSDGVAGPATFGKLDSTDPKTFLKKEIQVPQPAKVSAPKTQTASTSSKYPLKANNIKGIMQLHIPKINVHAGVLQGVGDEQKQLAVAPSLLEGSDYPDTLFGNVVIGAHRSTHGAIFRYIDALQKGDEITIDYNGKSYKYAVEKTFIIKPEETWVTGNFGYYCITLYACHPVGSDKYRYVVRGRLVD